MDSSFGEATSDCYVKAIVGDETFVTDVRKGTVNPMWEKALKFDVDPDERKKTSLYLKMYDDDLGNDEFLGMAKVRLNDLIHNGAPVSKWIELTDQKGGTKKDRGEIYITLRFGEPTEGDAMSSEDNVSCVALAQVPGYKLTRVQIHYCATLVQKVVRGWMARGGCSGLKAGKTAEAKAREKRVIMIQRKWREKKMWEKIKKFKKAMTNGGIFMKISSNGGKKEKRQVFCPGNMQNIYWREPGTGEEGTAMPVSGIVAILSGRKTRTFQLYDKRLKDEGQKLDKKKQDVSFSLVWAERTLDLEAAEEPQKNEWIDLFQFLLRDQMNASAFALIAKRKKQF